jgi:hypothetical protein
LAVLVGSSEGQRHVSLLVRDEPTGDYRAALSFQLERHGTYWMQPERPRFADLDGDGRPEVLLGFTCYLADRASRTAIVLARREGEWRALEPPSLLGTARDYGEAHGQGIPIYQDAKLQFPVIAGERLWLQGLHSGGGWHVVDRPTGGGAALLGIGASPKGPYLTSPRDYFLAMFRLTAGGYVLDPDWNGGEPLVIEGRVPIGAAAAQRWAR